MTNSILSLFDYNICINRSWTKSLWECARALHNRQDLDFQALWWTENQTQSRIEWCLPPLGQVPTTKESTELTPWERTRTSTFQWPICNSEIWTGSKQKRPWILPWRADKLCSILKTMSKPTVLVSLCLAYQIRKEDCETMARSYVADISQFLDIANKENVKILSGKTLIWENNHM